jgi:hypothetical protein
MDWGEKVAVIRKLIVTYEKQNNNKQSKQQ